MPRAEPADRIREDVIRGEFRVEGNVAVGKPFDLVFTIHPLVDMPGTSIALLLPEGASVAAGETEWHGDVAAQETVVQRVTLLLENNAEYDVRAVVKNPGGPDLNRVYHAFLDPSTPPGLKKAPKTQDVPQKERLRQLPKERSMILSGGEAQAANLSLAGNTVVVGQVAYETDDAALHPVRFHRAELWEYTGSQWVLLASGMTDEAGVFAFSISMSGSKTIVVDIFGQTVASMARSTTGQAYFAELGPKIIYAGVTNNVGQWYSDYSRDYWEASDYVLDAYLWVLANGSGWSRPPVAIEWPCGCWPQSNGNTIFLPNQFSIPWDRPTALHEYGHTIQHAAYGGFPSCWYSGSHYINTESCDEFAFTEGFAEFFQAAVDNDPNSLRDYTCGASQNVESNTWEIGRDCIANNSGAIVEGAVASILWDIFDANNYPYDSDRDSLSLGFDEIWYTMISYRPGTIGAFWAAWLNLGYGLRPQMNLIYYDHGVDMDSPPLAPSAPVPTNGAVLASGAGISLSWSASDPDGDALYYDVYLGTTSNPPLVASDLTTKAYAIPTPLAEGTYYWGVVARDALGKTTVGPLWQFTVCKNALGLAPGWNLISLPSIPPGTDPATALAPIAGRYDAVYAYAAADGADPWKQYVPAAPGASDLPLLDPSLGLWVHITSPSALCTAGGAPVTSTISLKAGWNLVGYPSPTARPAAEALASMGGKYDLVYAYDSANAADPWKKYDPAMPAVLNDLRDMVPGKGYWIHVSEDCTWTVP